MIRTSFEVKSTKEILNNTTHTVGRNKETVIDARDRNIHDLCHKGKNLGYI
jgi:sporulation protein YlmC with PRC-barrel domain